ncbi:MAG: oligosaccharide flippase family protein [Bacteroidia bacterium]
MRSLFANISLAVLLNVLIKPVWVFTEMAVHNAVGNEAWGTYAALLSLAFLFIVLSDLGINQYLTKTLASEPERLQELYPNLLALKLVLLLLYPAVMCVVGLLLGYSALQTGWLAALSLVWGLHQLSGYFRANFQALQRFRLDSFASILDRVVLLILVGVLFLTGLSVERFILLRLLAAGIVAGLRLFCLQRIYGWIAPKADRQSWVRLARLSLPFALITILNSIHDKVDQVMLERIIGPEATGLYAAAYRIMDMFNMYLWTTQAIIMARFAFFLKKPDEQSKVMRFGQVIVAWPMLFVAIFVFFFGEKLLFIYTKFTPEEIATTSQVLKILFIASFIHSMWVIYGTLLSVSNHEHFVNRAVFSGIALNVILNIILIPTMGPLAAAWSTVASFGLICILYVWRTHARTGVRVPYDRMALLLGNALLLAGMFWALGKTALPWWGTTAIAGLVYLGGSLASGLLSRRLLS